MKIIQDFIFIIESRVGLISGLKTIFIPPLSVIPWSWFNWKTILRVYRWALDKNVEVFQGSLLLLFNI